MATPTDQAPPVLTLETARLLLRPFQAGDYDAVHAYATDPLVYRYMNWGPNTPEATREVLDRWVAMQDEPWPWKDLNYAVVIKATGQMIGCVSLHDPGGVNGFLGYCYNSAFWRRGYGTEAAGAVMAIAFTALGHHRVWATCDIRNAGSWGIMERLGMRREGLLRQDQKRNSGWSDSYVYAILQDEWRSRTPTVG